MKILAIGYYDDFARFFMQVKQELKKQKVIDFRYFSIYASGFLYSILRLHTAIFLPLRVRLSVLCRYKYFSNKIKGETYHGINLDEVIHYHFLLNKKDRNKLLLQAVSYIDYYEKYLSKFSPDYIFLSGDTRMPIQILDQMAKQKGIATYYFEQGPFGTTIFDDKGVNANASIRMKETFPSVDDNKVSDIYNFLHRSKGQKYRRNPFYRGFDYLYQILASKIGLLPSEIEMEIKKGSSINEFHIKINYDKQRDNIILLILQVPFDANMVFHSPLFDNHADIVKKVYHSLPDGYVLIVREHPLYKQRYEEDLYLFMRDNAIDLDGLTLEDSLESAAVVVVNNSTVGIEAIAKGKPVVILGNCYYDNADIALKLNDINQLPNLLKEAINYNIDHKKVNSFLHYFLFDFLLDGHYKDEQLNAPKNIVNNRLLIKKKS